MTPATNALPALTSATPSSIYAGSSTFTLTANGSDFLWTSQVLLNQKNTLTTFVSFSQLQTDVSDFFTLYPGQLEVEVVTGPPGGGTSAILPVPVVPGGTPTGAIDVVSVATNGTLGDRESRHPAISPNGRFIAFDSLATNLATGGGNGHAQVFVRDTCFGVPNGCAPSTALVSTAADGSLGNGDSYSSAVGANGQFVAFESSATNLETTENNGLIQVCLHDRDVGQSGVFDQPGNTANILVSVAMDGTAGDMGAADASMSNDGRFVAFDSGSDNLVPNDTNAAQDVFVRDTCAGAPAGCTPGTVRASVATDGTEANRNSYSANPSLSGDGRLVAFDSTAQTFVPNSAPSGVYVHDTCFSAPTGCTPSTSVASVAANGAPANGAFNSMSADGRFVAFASGDLVPGDSGTVQNIYVRSTCQGSSSGCTPATQNVSVGSSGIQANGGSVEPRISPDGRFVGFSSSATNIAANNSHDTNGQPDFLLHDTCLGAPAGCVPATFQMSIANDGTQSFGNQGVDTLPNIGVSSNGLVVVFTSSASNLVPNTPSTLNIYRVVTQPH